MKPLLSHPLVTLTSRLVVGTVFIVASLDKIALPEAFAVSLVAYKLIPYAAVNLLAIILPWIELVCGIFLVFGIELKANAAMLGTLLGVFIIAIGTAMARDLNIDCGCFGAAHSTPVGWPKIIEDAGLLLMCAQMWMFPRSALSMAGQAGQPEPGIPAEDSPA